MIDWNQSCVKADNKVWIDDTLPFFVRKATVGLLINPFFSIFKQRIRDEPPDGNLYSPGRY